LQLCGVPANLAARRRPTLESGAHSFALRFVSAPNSGNLIVQQRNSLATASGVARTACGVAVVAAVVLAADSCAHPFCLACDRSVAAVDCARRTTLGTSIANLALNLRQASRARVAVEQRALVATRPHTHLLLEADGAAESCERVCVAAASVECTLCDATVCFDGGGLPQYSCGIVTAATAVLSARSGTRRQTDLSSTTRRVRCSCRARRVCRTPLSILYSAWHATKRNEPAELLGSSIMPTWDILCRVGYCIVHSFWSRCSRCGSRGTASSAAAGHGGG
jgi:hypothetical protein